jgi:hypothetical protein
MRRHVTRRPLGQVSGLAGWWPALVKLGAIVVVSGDPGKSRTRRRLWPQHNPRRHRSNRCARFPRFFRPASLFPSCFFGDGYAPRPTRHARCLPGGRTRQVARGPSRLSVPPGRSARDRRSEEEGVETKSQMKQQLIVGRGHEA